MRELDLILIWLSSLILILFLLASCKFEQVPCDCEAKTVIVRANPETRYLDCSACELENARLKADIDYLDWCFAHE